MDVGVAFRSIPAVTVPPANEHTVNAHRKENSSHALRSAAKAAVLVVLF